MRCSATRRGPCGPAGPLPTSRGRIDLACRALLASPLAGRTVLFEAGIGAFFEPRLRERYGIVEDRHVLLESLAHAGFTPQDIDVVVLSHLHFDHAGGLLSAWAPDTEPSLVFPRATYLVGRRHFERALDPHDRDRASFIPALPACSRPVVGSSWSTASIRARSARRCASISATAIPRG